MLQVLHQRQGFLNNRCLVLVRWDDFFEAFDCELLVFGEHLHPRLQLRHLFDCVHGNTSLLPAWFGVMSLLSALGSSPCARASFSCFCIVWKALRNCRII